MYVEDADMSVVIRAHFDGKTIVPDEPVDLPVGQSLEIELKQVPQVLGWDPEKAREAIKRIASRAVPANIPSEALRREHIYEPDRGL
jgi:hypothetical protein